MLLIAAVAQGAGEAEEGFRPLFDGRTLDGWHAIGGEATFTVDDGEILGVRGPGENTFLRTDREFADFVLELEVRFEEYGNSGILFRAQQREDTGRGYGLQYELDPSERGWSGGLYDEQRRQWLVPLDGREQARQALDRDGWNRVRIDARGGRIRTWLNGVPIADLADATDLEGFIALQVHAGDAGRIRFRDIRLKELGRHEWTRDYIADPGNWTLPGDGTLGSGEDGNLLIEHAGTAAGAPVRTKEALGDFGVRFGVDVCDGPTTIRVREWRADDGLAHAELILERDRATLAVGDAEPAVVSLGDDDDDDNGDGAGVRRVTITAVGDDLTAAIGETHVGRLHGRSLPARGILSIRSACGIETIHDPAWVDLDDGSRDEPLYRSLDVPDAPVLSPDEALASFRIAPGFRIELVAAEPLVEDPVAIAWDAAGRLYVVEMRGYMPDAFGHGADEPVGRVVLLEDTDADGRMDWHGVYLDGLVMPRAVAVVDGGVLIGEPPNLWLCRDTTGDDRCDEKTAVTGYGVNENSEGGSVEHLENALLGNIDNWIYNAKSERRFRVTDGRIETDETLARGQWGMTHDDEGRLFYNDNSNFLFADLYPADAVLRDDANDVPPGLGEMLLPDAEVFGIRVSPGVNRAYLPGVLREDGRLRRPTAVSGLTAYRGDQFPADMARDLFIPEPAANAVAQVRVTGDGPALAATHIFYPDPDWGRREFLASTDERFRPVDVEVGPDGALYVIDMYRGIIQDIVFLTEELREQIFARALDTPVGRGRIWRVVFDGAAPRRTPPALSSADADALVETLRHANGWHRDTAQRLLVARDAIGPDAVQALERMAATASPEAAMHALWTLEGRRRLTRETVLAALRHADARVVLQALRAGRAALTVADLLAVETAHRGAAAERITREVIVDMKGRDDAAVLDFLRESARRHAASPYHRVAVVAALEGRELPFLLGLLEEAWMARPDDAGLDLVSRLAANACRTLNAAGDAAALGTLLDTASRELRRGSGRGRAILEGLDVARRDASFTPAKLAAPHSLFDGSIGVDSPYWSEIRNARLAFTWPGDTFHDVAPLTAAQTARREAGHAFYERVCASCHHTRGSGVIGLAPPLAHSPWVTGPAEVPARILLDGMRGPVTIDGRTWDAIMPGHGERPELTDELAAGVLTYIRTAWGNRGGPVAPPLVREVREATAGRGAPWTAEELEAYLEAEP